MCGNGEDQSFFFELDPAKQITFRQTSNFLSSSLSLSLRYGGTFPGDRWTYHCVDNSDGWELAHYNFGSDPVPLYFIIDAHSSHSGEFELGWSISSLSGMSHLQASLATFTLLSRAVFFIFFTIANKISTWTSAPKSPFGSGTTF